MSTPTETQPTGDLPHAIGNPARRALDGVGITRLDQLAAWSEAELLKLHGVGPKAIAVLREALAARGLAFKSPGAPGASTSPRNVSP